MSQIKNKSSESYRTINNFIAECKKEVADTIAKIDGVSDKIKKTIESNVLAEYINK